MPHIPYVFLTSVILVSRVFATHTHLRHLRCLGVRCSYIVCFPAYSRRTLTFDTFGVSVSVARTLSAFPRIRDARSPSTPSVSRCPLLVHCLLPRVFATNAHLRHLRCLGVRCTHIVRSFGTSGPASSPDVPNGGLHSSLIRSLYHSRFLL